MTNKEFEQWTATRESLKRILGITESGLSLDKLAEQVERKVAGFRSALQAAKDDLSDFPGRQPPESLGLVATALMWDGNAD